MMYIPPTGPGILSTTLSLVATFGEDEQPIHRERTATADRTKAIVFFIKHLLIVKINRDNGYHVFS
jgi:hypothetical protein